MRLLACLCVLLMAISAFGEQGGDEVTLLLKGGTTAEGRIVRVEKDGVRLDMEFGGVKVQKLWTWDLLDDREPLKAHGEAHDVAPAEATLGVEVVDGARRVRGVVDERTQDLLVVRNRSGVFRFDPSRVEVRPTWLAWREVLGDEEMERRLVAPERLSSDEDCRRAGAQAASLGLDERANEYLRVAEVLSQAGRPDEPVFREIASLRIGPAGADRGRELSELRRKLVDQSYEEALTQVDELQRGEPQGGKELEAIRAEVERLREMPIAQRMPLYRDACATCELQALAMNRGGSWASTSARVREDLARVLVQRTMQRFGVDEETARRAWDQRPGERSLVANWGQGSWLAETEPSRDAEEWWAGASTDDRYAALRGLYAETCCRVVEVVKKECPACGGRGCKWVKASGGAAPPCDRCHGTGTARVVLYR